MGVITCEKIEIANNDWQNFSWELEVLAESAEQIESEESNYRKLMKEKLAKIHQYL